MAPNIPSRYHSGLTTQIAVRLPDDLVAFLDRLVEDGHARSRAAAVALALARDRRRFTALSDARILSGSGPDPDLEALAHHAVHTPLELE